MRNIILLICTLNLSLTSLAQQGDYYISEFIPKGNADAEANFDLVQRPDGVIAIANRGGLLLFDGKNWDMHPSKGTPLSLAVGEDGIFSGGAHGVEYYTFKDPGDVNKIHPDSLVGNVLQVKIIDTLLLAIEPKRIHIFSSADKSLLYSVDFPQGYIQKIIETGGQPLISTTRGNYHLKDQSLEFAGDAPQTSLIAAIPFHGYDWVMTSSGKFYEVADEQWREIKINTGEFGESLAGTEFLNAVKAKDKIAITTSNAGVVVIDVKSLSVDRLINHHNGLHDNEVYFISADAAGGIWVGHQNGLSRIAPYLPIKTFSNFPGLSGNLINAVHFNESLYVGTSTGLFRLEEVKDFNEVVHFIKKEKEQASFSETEMSKSKGLFSFLKRRKKEQPDNVQQDTSPEIIYEKEVTQKLISIEHLYKKVEEVNGKVNQLLTSNNELFVSTLSGLYRISDTEAELLSAEPIKFSWLNNNNDFLIASTFQGTLLSYRKTDDGGWEEELYFEGYQDVILDIYEDDKSRIWFASPEQFYFITYDANDIYAGREFNYGNLYLDPVFITQNEQGQVTFNNRYGKWVYNEAADSVYSSELSPGISSFCKSAGGIWINELGKWKLLSGNSANKWINALKDITYLTADRTGENIYVITAMNTLHKVPFKTGEFTTHEKYPLLLKSVTDDGKKLASERKLRFVQRKTDLSFEFVRPEFTGLTDVEYKFRIKGLSEDWSEWSSENSKIKFNYLPEGNYKLELKSRSALGEIVSINPLFFQVVLPYWKRPWFYAFEFTMLGLLLLLTIHLNNNAPRYRLLNKLLAFLTLIMIIEFIQASAESKIETDLSPVGSFFIQVTVAFMILPVEGFLRRLIITNKKLRLPAFMRLYRK